MSYLNDIAIAHNVSLLARYVSTVKKSESSRKRAFRLFLCLYKNAVELEREQKFVSLSHQGH